LLSMATQLLSSPRPGRGGGPTVLFAFSAGLIIPHFPEQHRDKLTAAPPFAAFSIFPTN
jgi:hypothetical protein